MDTLQNNDRILTKGEAQKMYIHFCHVCTLAEKMRVCGSCKFNAGLATKKETAKPVFKLAID